jgi:hypothetical protein
MLLRDPRWFSLLFAALALCLLVFTGCDGRPKRVPVAGTVYIDGKPLAGGQIRVIPTNARPAQAEIDKQGRFKLYTFDYEKNDGAVLGEHAVEIKAAETAPGGMRFLIPKKYFDAATSGVTIKVEKPTDDMRIDLTWDGGAPFVEASENRGDAAPVGAVPMETTPTSESPTPAGSP